MMRLYVDRDGLRWAEVTAPADGSDPWVRPEVTRYLSERGVRPVGSRTVSTLTGTRWVEARPVRRIGGAR